VILFLVSLGKGRRHGSRASCEEATSAFLEFSNYPDDATKECLRKLERFVVLLYNRTSAKMRVNEARRQLFTQKGKSIESIPPAQAAPIQHTRRAAYQGGHFCYSDELAISK